MQLEGPGSLSVAAEVVVASKPVPLDAIGALIA
jgi:hypothetical protein